MIRNGKLYSISETISPTQSAVPTPGYPTKHEPWNSETTTVSKHIISNLMTRHLQ